MSRKSIIRWTIGFLVFLATGMAIFMEFEGFGLVRSLVSFVMFTTTPGPDFTPSNTMSQIATGLFSIFNFVVLVLALPTIVIPPVLRFADWNTKGTGIVLPWDCWFKQVILLVNPVDWDKVASLLEVFGDRTDIYLVVVSGTLENMPDELHNEDRLRYISGNPFSKQTYQRAGVKYVTAAIVLAGGYNDAEAEDRSTGVYAEFIERHWSHIHTVCEGVNPKHAKQFPTALNGLGYTVDAVCWFDTCTMSAVAAKVKQLVGDTAAQVSANTLDEFQTAALQGQLAAHGISISQEGNKEITVYLPTNLNDPMASEMETLRTVRALNGARADSVVLHLSVTCRDAFAHMPHVLCVDEIMAKALVAKLLEVQN